MLEDKMIFVGFTPPTPTPTLTITRYALLSPYSRQGLKPITHLQVGSRLGIHIACMDRLK